VPDRTSPSIVFSIRLYEYQSSRPILRQAYYFTTLLDILRFFFRDLSNLNDLKNSQRVSSPIINDRTLWLFTKFLF